MKTERRELLDKESATYKSYPYLSIFLIEEVYKDDNWSNVSFFITQYSSDLHINFTNNNGVKSQNQTPLSELNDWPIDINGVPCSIYFSNLESAEKLIHKYYDSLLTPANQ